MKKDSSNIEVLIAKKRKKDVRKKNYGREERERGKKDKKAQVFESRRGTDFFFLFLCKSVQINVR